MNVKPQPVANWPDPAYIVRADYALTRSDCDYLDDYVYRFDANRLALIAFEKLESAMSFCKQANQRDEAECLLVVTESSLRECYDDLYEYICRLAREEPRETLLIWMSPVVGEMRKREAVLHYAEAVLAFIHANLPPEDRHSDLTDIWDTGRF